MMLIAPGQAIVILWLGWLASWVVAALWSNPTESRPPVKKESRYRVPMIVGFGLLTVPAHGYVGPLRLWYVGWSGAWTCVAVVALGIGFAWWARVHLGRLWSARITRKLDHRIVDSGPYGWVRHPIYSGLLLSLVATAAAKGTILGIGGVLAFWLGFWIKARQEEDWLRKELGINEYDAYCKRVPMLLPFGPRR
jgi:protein-S-isoprenylcysteine O-methyltransferase Ste14